VASQSSSESGSTEATHVVACHTTFFASVYDLRLHSLGLWPLEERQNRADLVEVFKLYKGWYTTRFDSMFTLNSNTQTRGHSAKLTKNSIRLELRRHFFSECVIGRWNRLDQQVI